MKETISTRMGDGQRVFMPKTAVKEDLLKGTKDAAEKGSIPELTSDDLEQLFDIFAEPSRVVSVSPGSEVIVTDDGCNMSFYSAQDSGGVGIPLTRLQAVLTHERACAADTTSIGHGDYSFKPIKPIINYETHEYYNASMLTTVPLFYGAQPNLGLYFRPDGPFPNPWELMNQGEIKASFQAQEAAAEKLTRDIVFVGKKLSEVGCEGINLDTAGSAGDVDFYAALQAVVALKQAAPEMGVELGSSGEFIMGMHGEIRFDGKRVAGMYPHQQVKAAEAAGVDIYGPAVNTDTAKSIPWNLARAVTFVKQTVFVANIPVHVNVGMGVGGIPMLDEPPIDCVQGLRRHWWRSARRMDCRLASVIPLVCRLPILWRQVWEASGPPEIWWPGCKLPVG